MSRISLDDPRYYCNRHLSWLEFNRRVLEEALDPHNPLLERVKFLAITASNLDEFVEVRLAGLLQQVEHGSQEMGPDGLAPHLQLKVLAAGIREFVTDQYKCWNQKLLPALSGEKIRILPVSKLNSRQRDEADLFYARQVDPLLSPVTIDPAHPFPHVLNKALCVAFLLRRRGRASESFVGVVTVPRKLPRLVRIRSDETIDYVFLHDLIANHARNLYRGYEVISTGAFRVTRNSNLYLHEEEARNLLETVDGQLHDRRKGDVVRLEIDAEAAQEIVEPLRARFALREWQVFKTPGPVNLSRLFFLAEQTPRPDLKFRSFVPRSLALDADSKNVFDQLRKHDILLHHPYDAYDAVVNLIEQAARDPQVLSIRQTLYRTSEDSPIARALMEAAQTKDVTVVVELKARFDEASNIRWAKSLEEAGVQVSHGVVGLKTHCKLALLVRHDSDGEIRRYAHLGTGNYNPSTARFYTDLSLLTADPHITQAVQSVFSFLTARAERGSYRPLFLAPTDLAASCVDLIDREAANARRNRPARIIAKVNALLDPGIIQALYRASQAGVEIDLIVRGGCALRPGVRGLSHRIRVRSIVGRFLEHSRIYYFENAGEPEIYLGSADWMPRNLYERVEVMFPLHNPELRRRIYEEILLSYLSDTAKSRILNRDGSYTRAHQLPGKLNGKRFAAQDFLIQLAEGKSWYPATAVNGESGIRAIAGAAGSASCPAKAAKEAAVPQ
ncbi:MAG TPA: polyphosphate kinase 1 [Candidatus Angelobacter sp.]|nr:polyphosphate kinase 1 [Candidatus Angelobacter sp.]